MHSAFLELAIILSLSSVLGYLVRYFRQPLLTAYLFAGLVISVIRIVDPNHSITLTFLPDFGIAFVLFFIGMELDLDEVKALGWPITVASVFQILISTLFGFTLAGYLGFGAIESLYLGLGLGFSSTIVVVKMLLERKDLNSLYGKLSLGVLLLEDVIAVLFLMIMTVGESFFNTGLQNAFPIVTLLIKGILLFLLAIVCSKWVLNRVFKAMAHNGELLFLTSLAWCFSFVALSQLLGFSLTIGAFLAGVALASSPYHLHISGKIKPLRDFFVALFFIYLGSQVQFASVTNSLLIILLFTAYAVLVKPIIFLLIFGAFGFKKHTIFQTAINMTQISEFSLIIALVGLKNGVIAPEILSIVALTGVLSIFISSFLITFSKQIYSHLNPFIGFFVRPKFVRKEEQRSLDQNFEDHIVLIGAHRVGGQIVEYLRKEDISHLVVDFNPKIVQTLMDQGVPAIYGDIGDPEILDALRLEKAAMIISTSDDHEDNLHLLIELKRRRIQAAVVVRASGVEDAKSLYESGADYVILPEIASGDFFTQQLKTHWPNLKFFKERSDIEMRKISKHHLQINS
jgi:Kef-type K+ transport system membrane component KefB